MDIKNIKTPINNETIEDLQIGDRLEISGVIYTGRDAVLPKLVRSIENGSPVFDLNGSAVMHTAVSDAGISPTTSNKEEIEECIPYLAKHGVKLHLGKGAINKDTIESLDKYDSVFAVTPPAAALLTSRVVSREVIAFEEEGMEAIHSLTVIRIPCVVAAAHGITIY